MSTKSIACFAPPLIKLCVVFFLSSPVSGPSWGAEIKQLNNWIILTGPVENGDFEKFADIIETQLSDPPGRHYPITGVALYSKGGAALEAVKIGRAVRKLRLRTTGPTSEFGNRTLVYCPPGLGGADGQSHFDTSTGEGSDLCACDSACALIWSAGILRNGRVGFHRPHFTEVEIGKFDTFEANGREARHLVEQYMNDMDLPAEIVIATATTGRNELFYVDARQGYARTPVFDDLTTSECSYIGEIQVIEAEMRNLEDEKTDAAQGNEKLSLILNKYGDFAACHVEVQERLAAKAFTKIKLFLAELKLKDPMISTESLSYQIKSYISPQQP